MLFFLTLNLLLNIVHTYIRKLPDDSHIESKWANLVFPDNSIDKVKNLYEELSPSRWEYNVNCRLRFPSKPIVDNHYQKDRCLVDGVRKPAICFQEPIHYNYTWNPELATFPHQFAVIQRFPKCWSKLGPLLCGSIYRPCSLKNVFKHAGSKTKLIKAHDEGVTTDELWQVFPPDFCQNAAKDCSFLEDLKLWPSFLRCSDQVPVQLISTLPEGTQSADLKLFNPNCKVAYVQSPSEPEIYQCLWPLVYRRLDKAVSAQPKPLIDDCYMPCRSALLATRHTFDYFYFCAAVLCVVSFSIYFYLAWLSQAYIDHFKVFLLSRALLSFSIYFLLMFLPFLDFFFKTAICTSDGIRKEVGQAGFDFHGLQNFFDPCNLGGSQLLFSSICSSGWIFALLLNHLLFGSHQSVSDDKVRLYVTSTNVSSPTAISSRTLHSVLIYIMSAIYTLLVLLLSQVHMEPRLGICHYGTTNSHESLYLHLPTIVLLFVLFFVFVGLVVDKAKAPKTPEKAAMPEDMTLTKSALIKEEREIGPRSDLAAINESKLSSLFPSEFFGILLILVVFSSVATLAGYFLWQSHDINEKGMVLQSVLCSLQATIYGNNTSLDWMQHSSWKEDMVLSPLSNPDPYSRRHNLQSHISAPSCYLPVQEDWIYLLVSLLVLPSLPFLLIFVWFLSGLCKHVSYSSQLCEIRAEILSCKRRPSLPKRLSTISSEYSTTSNRQTSRLPRTAFSNNNINYEVIRVNGSDKTTCRSYPTSDPRHKRRNVSQWLEKSRKQHRQTKKPSALLHVDPANQLFSDGVSVNSSSTFDLTSVSEKRGTSNL